MSGPVDVLACLDWVRDWAEAQHAATGKHAPLSTLAEARADVAALLEAAGKVAARELPPVTEANASEQYDMLGLRAALARCKGGAA